MSRYIVFEGSASAHCCFKATVMDSTKPSISTGTGKQHESDGVKLYETVCECFGIESANTIVKALNRGE